MGELIIDRLIALLVEDEALVAMVTEDQLREIGFEVRSAANGYQALGIIEMGAHPSLAVIDVGLPDMRGDELAKRLRDIAPDIRIVIASGYDAITIRRQIIDPSMVTVVSKPYTEEDLVSAIRLLGFDVGLPRWTTS